MDLENILGELTLTRGLTDALIDELDPIFEERLSDDLPQEKINLIMYELVRSVDAINSLGALIKGRLTTEIEELESFNRELIAKRNQKG
ncbi:hypothetical protein [Limosilactobacillus caviae]|uniref:hypothetical protein n=1 Tax=Limosilactobacillus caviae TaxID=1769424 RepID=UPI003513ED58